MPTDEYGLKRAVKTGRAGVYVLYGDEAYLIRQYERRISEKTVTGNEVFNRDRFDGSVTVQGICDAVGGMPFGPTRRYVGVCDLPVEKLSQADFNTLCGLLSDPVPTAVLVLWFETVEVPQKKPSARWKRLFNAVEKGGGVAACLRRRSDAELAKALSDGAVKRGCRISDAVSAYTVSVCGGDLFSLSNELEKLCAYSAGGEITEEAVDRICCRAIDASVYGISRALFGDDLQNALEIIDDLFYTRVEPTVIFSGIADSYVDICRARAAERAGISNDAAAERFGYGNRAFRLKNAAKTAKAFTDGALIASLRRIAETDAKLKSSRDDKKTLLQVLLVELYCIKAGIIRDYYGS